MKDVIIEVRGGVVVEVYCDNPCLRFSVIDWDHDIRNEEGWPRGFKWFPASFSAMPQDSSDEFKKILIQSG